MDEQRDKLEKKLIDLETIARLELLKGTESEP